MQLTLATQAGTFAITRRYRDKQYKYQVTKYMNGQSSIVKVSKTITEAINQLDTLTTT